MYNEDEEDYNDEFYDRARPISLGRARGEDDVETYDTVKAKVEALRREQNELQVELERLTRRSLKRDDD